MNMRQWGAALLFFWVLVFGLGAQRALAAIVLESFTATPGDSQILLAWETSAEVDNAGFYVNRSLQITGNYVRISPLIPAEGSAAAGAAYTFTDVAVINGVTYYYWLEAEDTQGNSDFSDPVSAVPAAATVTPTPTETASASPTTSGTPPGTVTPTGTATPVRTATPTRTVTPTPGPSPTPTLTPTPTDTPTATPLPTFLPTRTPTATFFPTPTWTASPSPTQGPLLEATLSPGTPTGFLPRLADQAGLTLGEAILLVTVLVAMIGGILFVGLAYLVLRRGPG